MFSRSWLLFWNQETTQWICKAMQSNTSSAKRAQHLLPNCTSRWPHDHYIIYIYIYYFFIALKTLSEYSNMLYMRFQHFRPLAMIIQTNVVENMLMSRPRDGHHQERKYAASGFHSIPIRTWEWFKYKPSDYAKCFALLSCKSKHDKVFKERIARVTTPK